MLFYKDYKRKELNKMKIAFFGTPLIGSKALESLIKNKDIKVEVVVTVPDRKIGRSHSNKQPSPVALLAIKHNTLCASFEMHFLIPVLRWPVPMQNNLS